METPLLSGIELTKKPQFETQLSLSVGNTEVNYKVE